MSLVRPHGAVYTSARVREPNAKPELTSLKAVLAVCAHPDDESFGLGAVVVYLTDGGRDVALICLTHGEASTLGDHIGLLDLRKKELEQAGRVLGLTSTRLLDYPDGRLDGVPLPDLIGDIMTAINATRAEALIVFDPEGVTGHDDHRRATAAARAAAATARIPVLAWVIPSQVADALNRRYGTRFNGYPMDSVDFVLEVDRARQLRAIEEHASESLENPVLRHRLELMGFTEWLMWLGQEANS